MGLFISPKAPSLCLLLDVHLLCKEINHQKMGIYLLGENRRVGFVAAKTEVGPSIFAARVWYLTEWLSRCEVGRRIILVGSDLKGFEPDVGSAHRRWLNAADVTNESLLASACLEKNSKATSDVASHPIWANTRQLMHKVRCVKNDLHTLGICSQRSRVIKSSPPPPSAPSSPLLRLI